MSHVDYIICGMNHCNIVLLILTSQKSQEKQFTIILELLGDNKLESLTADERRSLALLKDGRRSSPFVPRYANGSFMFGLLRNTACMKLMVNGVVYKYYDCFGM